ncbi:MAG: GNVR domain-containing protein [Candidatus Omnitrophota bacterium]
MENHGFIKNRNPVEYLKIFFRRKWLFISPIFLGLVISILACFLLPPTYQSSTVILVEEEKIINPLIRGLAVSTSVADRIRTLREQILSWNSLVTLTKKLNLAKNVQSQGDFEGLILKLRRNIVVQLGGANLIRITYFGENPEKTQLITKTLTDIFIDENMRSQTKETDVAIDFIKDQLQVYKRKIKESEIADMEERLKKLLADSTEQHPLVRDLRQKIEAAKNELGAEGYDVSNLGDKPINSPMYESLQQELQEELDKIIGKETTGLEAGALAFASDTGENTDPNASIYKLLLMDKLDSVLARDMRINENIYNMLLQKLETAKITQRLEVSKEGTRYSIIDPPRLPLKPTKPNKLLVIFLGVFFGSCAGTGLVFGKEFMDHSFLDIEDAKNNLDLPILGAISRLTTQEEIDREKYQKKRLTISVLASSFVLILIVMLVSLFRK